MEEKISRICWNDHNWKRPSGPNGKSRYKDSYENIQGFGHEEWLLDDTMIMPEGYHYGFLESLNVKSGIHVGKTYKIHLFSKKNFEIQPLSKSQQGRSFIYHWPRKPDQKDIEYIK